MADREAMRNLIDQAYAARERGDLDGVMTAFHPDAVFELKGEKRALAVAGAVQGHPNVRETMAGLIAAFEFKRRDIISIILEGDHAAVHSRLLIRFAPKDLTFSSEVMDMFKFQDGKIIELVEFADTALIKEVISE